MPAVLVTGGARRIGRAIVERLAVQGFAVAVHYHRSQAEAQAVATRALALGAPKAAAVAADLSAADQAQALLGQAAEALGEPITALVNNASLFDYDDWQSVSDESWQAHLATNTRAPFELTRALALALPKGMTGAVVNLIDQRVLHNLSPHFFSYTVSKAALWTLTQTLAQALAPQVRVNAVAPGPVLANVHQPAEAFAQEALETLLQQSVPPEEIAAAVAFLLTSRSITGQMLAVDSGQHLMPRPFDRRG